MENFIFCAVYIGIDNVYLSELLVKVPITFTSFFEILHSSVQLAICLSLIINNFIDTYD